MKVKKIIDKVERDPATERVLWVALLVFVMGLVATLGVGLFPVPTNCGPVACSPEVSVGNFHFTTPLLVLLIVQVVGIVGLVLMLWFVRRGEGQSAALSVLANNSPLFNLTSGNTTKGFQLSSTNTS